MTKANKTESVAEILKRRKEAGNKKLVDKPAKKKPKPKKVIKKKPAKTQKNSKKNNKPAKLNSDVKGLKHLEGYLSFIDFIATPSHLREYKTQGEFAKTLGVDQTTLVAWKKRQGFYEDVREKRKNLIREDHLSLAISALLLKIGREGNAKEVKLLFQLADEFEEKSVVETRSKIKELSTERKEQILKNMNNWRKK